MTRVQLLAIIESIAVDVAGCKLWPLGTNDQGYAYARVGGRVRRVSRIVLADHLGRALRAREGALHTCDTPRCVNPEHLFPGSQRVNLRDAVAKGRPVGRPRRR